MILPGKRFAIALLIAAQLLFRPEVGDAQDINLPPRQDSRSPTGVSYKSGAFFYQGPTLSIGGAFPAGLQLTIDYQSSRAGGGLADVTGTPGWSHNFVGAINRGPIPYSPDEMPPPDPKKIPAVYTVSVGPQSFSFLSGKVGTVNPGSVYQPMSPSGATLSYTPVGNGGAASGSYFTLTMADGSVAILAWYGNGSSRIDSFTTPDGTRLDFSYQVSSNGNKVLRSIFSSRGYALLFDDLSRVCAVNLAESYVTSSSSCPSNASSLSFSFSPSSYISGVDVLSGITDSAGNTTTFAYTGADHLGCVVLPGQSACQIQNNYDECIPPPEPPAPGNLRLSDRVVSQTTASGESYSYSYEFVGNYTYCSDFTGYGAITTMTGPSNAITVVHTNGAGMPTVIKDPLSQTTSLSYEDNVTISWEQAIPSSVTQAEGNGQYVVHDERGNAIEKHTLAKPGSGLAEQLIVASYPTTCANPRTCNKPDYVLDARGNRTEYTYDPTHGGILSETRPPDASGIRPQKRYGYSQLYAYIKDSGGGYIAAGAPIWVLTSTSECMTTSACLGTADEIRTTIEYGTAGSTNSLLPSSTSVSSGNGLLVATTSKTYDFAGNAVTNDGPLSGGADIVRTRYDALRRVVGEIGADPDGGGPLPHRATRNTYDSAGRLIKVERGTVNSQSDADWIGFVSLETLDTQYDVMGRKIKETKSGGGTIYAVTQYSYDPSGRLECTATRMDPAVWQLQTNACVPQTSGPFGPDRISRNFYNLAGERTTLQLAVGTADQSNEETYTYTSNGKLGTVLDGEGNLTTYEYDGHDRLSVTRFPVPTMGAQSSSTTDYEQLSYDANNNITQRRLRDGQVVGSSVDALNRVTDKDLPTPETDVSFTYDLQGKPLLTTQGSRYVSLTYNALGHLVSEVTDQSVMSYESDEAGRRKRTTWPDGFYVTQDFLNTGEVQSVRENGASAGVGVLAQYVYDSLGRRVSIVRGNGTTTSFGYDGVSRLQGLSHNLAGTATDVSSTFGFNPASQIVTWSRNNDVYIWTGTNQSKSFGTNGLNQLTSAGGISISYDLRGNLTTQGASLYTYSVENRLLTGPSGSTFIYDPIGRLIQSSGSSGTSRLQYDGTDLTAEYNASNQIVRRYVHGPGADEPLVWYEGSGTSDRRWFHQDERGSIVAVTNSSGAAIAINAYDEYGVPASTNAGRFQYTGQTYMPDIGMYYYKARVYSPTLGRFLQTDPIGYKDGTNLYSYVKGDPIDRTDPSGEILETLWDVANVAMDATSLVGNIKEGNVGSALVDAGGLIVDSLATIVPVVPGGAGVAIKSARAADKAREILKANKVKGKAGEAITRQKLGDKVVGEQVTFKTSDGQRARSDFVTTDKGIVETKTGNASLSKGQDALKSDVDAGREVTPVGQNAARAGLKPGEPVKMSSCTIDRPCP